MVTIRQKLNTYAITISTHLEHRHFQRPVNAEFFINILFRYREGEFLLGQRIDQTPAHLSV